MLSNTCWNHLTNFNTASPRTLASHVARSSRTSSTGSARTSPPPEMFESRPPRLPLPPLQSLQSVDKLPLRRSTIDQPSSSQITPPFAKPPPSPPPSPLSLPRRFNTVGPVHVRSASEASSPSPVGGAWERREGEYILIEFQAEWCSSRRSGSQDADNMGICDFRIFELEKDDSLPTRRIAFRSCENWEQCISYCEAPRIIDILQHAHCTYAGMPLDNVHVGTEHGKATVSWSDCSHIHEAKKGYRTSFTCVSQWDGSVEYRTNIGTQRYIPAKHNRRLEFESKDVSGYSTYPTWHYNSDDQIVIQKVAEVLLFPTLEYSHYEQNQVVTGSSTIDTLRVYKHHTGGKSAHKGADEWSDFAILVSSNSTNSTRCSRIYVGRSCLDFQRDKVQGLLIFKKMRCLNYISSLEKPSEKAILRHRNPEGGPDTCDWKIEDLELSPTNHKGRHEL